MRKCESADKYTPVYPPQCDNGKGCDVCKAKWYQSLIDRGLVVPRE